MKETGGQANPGQVNPDFTYTVLVKHVEDEAAPEAESAEPSKKKRPGAPTCGRGTLEVPVVDGARQEGGDQARDRHR